MFLLKIGQKLIVPLMVIVCILLIGMLQLGFIFLLLALLPSIAAYFVDMDYEHSVFRTIFACNLAAALPSLTPMFISGLKFKHYDIESTITDPKVWLFIYSGAAIGWGMIYFGFTIGRVVLTIQHKFQATMLERSQARLLEEWGEQVRGEVEKVKAIESAE